MNKRILMIFTSLVVILLLIVLVLPYYLGIKTEQSLQKQQAILVKNSVITISNHTYKRGWFSSSETMVLHFKPTFLSGIQQKLPDNVRTVLQQPITVVNHIHHGLFAGGLKPVRAQVTTEFKFTPETQQILARFFGQQSPLQMQNTLDLNGHGSIHLHIPKFNYEELSGIKLVWEGLESKISYSPDLDEYDTEILNPGLKLVLADKGTLSYKDLAINTHTENGKFALALGNSKVTLAQFALQWRQGISYDVRLNDLINFVSDLQIGAFINPTGSIPPSRIEVQNLYLSTDMEGQDQWINSHGQFGFDKLLYGQQTYGPLQIDASAEHLDAQSLADLKNKLRILANQNLNEEQLRTAIVSAARNEGLELFTHDPLIKLNRFKLQLPEGLVDIQGTFGLKNLQAADMQQFGTMLRKIQSQMNINIPQVTLENFAVTQARALFTADNNLEGENALADIDQTIRLLVDNSLKTMHQKGYLTIDRGIVKTAVQLNNGQLLFNHKTLMSEPELEPEDWDEGSALSSSETWDTTH